MPRVVVKENEDLDAAMRRFKRQVNNSGVLAAARSKEYYVKPGVKRRLKSEAARKKNKKRR
ncbi:MAG: 30S ribosomal protein S21 [Solobacterium sp.]|nr:30S ribosomal protein S21 [Solobacterium sp.]